MILNAEKLATNCFVLTDNATPVVANSVVGSVSGTKGHIGEFGWYGWYGWYG
jgi:hypothetical protein